MILKSPYRVQYVQYRHPWPRQPGYAGTAPDATVSDVMLASLAELGIDRSDQVPSLVADQLLDQAHVIVAV